MNVEFRMMCNFITDNDATDYYCSNSYVTMVYNVN